jgi:hypothetical protein
LPAVTSAHRQPVPWMTTVLMLPPPPVPELPSSHVRMIDPLFRYHAELWIAGSVRCSHASTLAFPQSCPSLHRFGVIQTKSGSRFGSNCEKGTTFEQIDGLLVMFEKYANGS